MLYLQRVMFGAILLLFSALPALQAYAVKSSLTTAPALLLNPESWQTKTSYSTRSGTPTYTRRPLRYELDVAPEPSRVASVPVLQAKVSNMRLDKSTGIIPLVEALEEAPDNANIHAIINDSLEWNVPVVIRGNQTVHISGRKAATSAEIAPHAFTPTEIADITITASLLETGAAITCKDQGRLSIKDLYIDLTQSNEDAQSLQPQLINTSDSLPRLSNTTILVHNNHNCITGNADLDNSAIITANYQQKKEGQVFTFNSSPTRHKHGRLSAGTTLRAVTGFLAPLAALAEDPIDSLANGTATLSNLTETVSTVTETFTTTIVPNLTVAPNLTGMETSTITETITTTIAPNVTASVTPDITDTITGFTPTVINTLNETGLPSVTPSPGAGEGGVISTTLQTVLGYANSTYASLPDFSGYAYSVYASLPEISGYVGSAYALVPHPHITVPTVALVTGVGAVYFGRKKISSLWSRVKMPDFLKWDNQSLNQQLRAEQAKAKRKERQKKK